MTIRASQRSNAAPGAAMLVALGAALAVPALGSGCGKASPACEGVSGCVQAEGADGGPLMDCIVGAWRPLGTGGNCAPIPCRPDAGPAECAQSDCVKHGYTVVVPGAQSSTGTMFIGSFVMSESTGTWSAAIPPERFSYRVQGSVLETEGSSGRRTQEMTCTQEQIVFGQLSVHTRVPSNEADALRALVTTDAGTWSSVPRP